LVNPDADIDLTIDTARQAGTAAVTDKISAVGVDSIQVTNETTQQNALRSRLALDGFFASAVPVVEGLNRVQVLGRANAGSIGRDSITVHYEPGGKRSLDLEFFCSEKRVWIWRWNDSNSRKMTIL
jgi:hypothetical protein